jgi:dTDP-glucose 4,6-dehydratase
MWTLLIAGQRGAVFNMGSEEAVSIADLARRTADVLGGPGVEVLGQPDPGWNPGRYVPSTVAIRRELGLSPTVDLDEAIRRTALANGWEP